MFSGKCKTVPDLNIFHEKMSYFVLFSMFGFTLVIKLRNFDFEKDMMSDLYMSYEKMSDFV